MVQNTETTQEIIRMWFDFVWELCQHPLVSLILGFLGGAHIDGGVRRLYGKTGRAVGTAIKKVEEITHNETKP